jgi:hypothetical protein
MAGMTIPKDPEIQAVAGAFVIAFWGLFGYVVFVAPQLRKWRAVKKRKTRRKSSTLG